MDAAHTPGCVQDWQGNLCLGQEKDAGIMKRCQKHTATSKGHTCGATSWAVGCRLAGETELCLLRAPSQQEEEPVPQAGGQTQEAFEDNAGRGTSATVSPTAFRSHPDLIKLTSRRKCPCQINYETKLVAAGT